VVINLERTLGLYHEETIQKVFLSVRPLMKAFNVYYGSAHFLVTAGVLAWLFVRHPDRYPRWRWTLACTTLLGLVGFLSFPLMPPRLISPSFDMGAYVDTLHTIGGLWNFEDGAIAKLSNQYAAMPSLHFAWSLWCCLGLWPHLRRSRSRALAVLHPTITLVAIVATANHYWLDALGGAVALLGGWLLGGVLLTRAIDHLGGNLRSADETAPVPASAVVTAAEPAESPAPTSSPALGFAGPVAPASDDASPGPSISPGLV